jgi:hypothetical protein
VQLGLTATPKRSDNADTYRYFGEPVYTYSLKDGIEDGYLTPFRVRQISTTLDEYVFTSDDTVVEGEIESGRVYVERDFNNRIDHAIREAVPRWPRRGVPGGRPETPNSARPGGAGDAACGTSTRRWCGLRARDWWPTIPG